MNRWRRNVWCLAAATLAATAGTPALAQQGDKDDDQIKGDFRQPLDGTKARDRARLAEERARQLEDMARDRIISRLAGGSGDYISMVESGPDGKFELRISNGKTTARVNGEDVPAERIRRDGNKVEILGQDGGVVKTFELPTTLRAGIRRADPLDGLRALEMLRSPMPGQQPRVMIGVTLADLDEDQLKERGVKRGGGVLIEDVIDGLPADQAGVQVDDVVVAINGKPVEDQGELREILQTNNPGDEVTLTVVREGKEQELKVKLQAFDGSRLGQMWVTPQAPEGDDWFQNFSWSGDDWREDVEEALRDAMEAVREAKGEWKDVKREVLEQLESALAEVEKAGRQFRGYRNLFLPGDGRGIMITPAPTPPAPPAPGAAAAPDAPTAPAPAPRPRGGRSNASADQMERLLQQLEKMNERLDRLEKERGDR